MPKQSGNDLIFEWEDLKVGDRITATYEVEASDVGMQPLRDPESEIWLEDSLERIAPAQLVPTRTIEVVPCITPSPTPDIPPTDTPTPTPSPTEIPPTDAATAIPTVEPSATPTPTPYVQSVSVFLPILMRKLCRKDNYRLATILLIDASSSMEQDAGDGRTRIEAARDAAGIFVDQLDLEAGDQAAIISFNSQATLGVELTNHRPSLDSAIAAIRTDRGTRMDSALSTALDMVRSQIREDELPAVILMTDGQPESGSREATKSIAAELRAAGPEFYAIGLGGGFDGFSYRNWSAGRIDSSKRPMRPNSKVCTKLLAASYRAPVERSGTHSMSIEDQADRGPSVSGQGEDRPTIGRIDFRPRQAFVPTGGPPRLDRPKPSDL